MPDEVTYPAPPGPAAGTTFLRNISDPTLSVFSPADGSTNGIGVIVVPGGGWTINAWTHEGLDVARWLTSLGCTAFLLKYRVQAGGADQRGSRPGWPRSTTPSTQRSRRRTSPRRSPISSQPTRTTRPVPRVRTTDNRDPSRRELAPDLGVRVDAIGMLGFSAGAFLAVDVALDPRADQLAFIAPIYGGETRGTPVPADAPPLFTAVAQDDTLVRIVEGLHAAWSASARAEHAEQSRRVIDARRRGRLSR